MSNSELHPLKFETIFKDKIWGGTKIRDVLGKDFSPLPNCGETWELSGVEGNISIVKEGPHKGSLLTDMISRFGASLLGESVMERFGDEFPLLIKFIDAADDLSIQVHPNDQQALEKHSSRGKTEMWYIMDSEPNARLISGFSSSVDKGLYLEKLNEGSLMDIMKWVPVYKDDVFFIPAGKVHSIGKGILLAEIQETSDITYRIYDFDRIDDSGKKRELHNEQAIDVIDFEVHNDKVLYQDKLDSAVEIVRCEYFTTNKIDSETQIDRDLSSYDSFTVYICLEGNCEINNTTVSKGEVVLVPAAINKVSLIPAMDSKLLEVYIS